MEFRLAYRDRYVRSLLGLIPQDTSNDTVFNELALDSETTYYLVLEVTGLEYRKMFASMLAGTELIYPEESHGLHWLFWRAAKDMTLCDAVKVCIESGVLDDAINNVVAGNPDAIIPEDELFKNLSDGLIVDCEDDIWGACITVVDGIFDTTLEVLQKISLTTEPLAAFGEISELMPIVGKIVGVAGALVDWITDTALTLFEAVDSVAVREAIACDLFCYCSDDCTITYDRINAAFEDNLVAPIPIPIYSSLKDKIDWLLGLILSGEPNVKIAATVNMLGVWTLIHGGEFGSYLMSVRSIDTLIALGIKDNSSNQWALLCTACANRITINFDDLPGTTYTLPYIADLQTQSTRDETVGNPLPSAKSGNGYVAPNYFYTNTVTVPLPAPSNVVRAQFDYLNTNGNKRLLGIGIVYFDENDVVLGDASFNWTPDLDTWYTAEDTQSIDNVSYIQFRTTNSNAGSQQSWASYIDNIVIDYHD